MLGLSKVLAVGFSCAVLSACVSDPTVEDDVPARAGARQPGATGSETVSVADACERILAAETSARDKLDCAARTPAPACPSYLSVAGAQPCDSYAGSTVSACETEIENYGSCDDFDTQPCIVTAIAASCHAPVAPSDDGGADASHPGKSDGGQTEGGTPDGAAPHPPDASAPPRDASADGGAPPDAAITDSGTGAD